MNGTKASRRAAAMLVAVLWIDGTACSRDTADDRRPTQSTARTETVEPGVVGVAYDVGGRGDRAANDSAALGLDDARRALGLTGIEATPSSDAERSTTLEGLVAAGSDLVIGVGPAYSDAIAATAAANPGIAFGAIDAAVPGPNVRSNLFATEEGAFILGAAAAKKSQSGRIGFIGSPTGEISRRLEVGFVAGVAHVDSEASVDVSYLETDAPSGSDLADPARQVAASMYESGVDVIFQAAGGSGAAVFDAAVEAGPGAWVIGKDVDHYRTATPEQQEHILTSMVERLDLVVRASIDDYLGGAEDGTAVRGLDGGYLEFARTGGYVDDIADDLADLERQIVSGEVVVPTA